MESRKLQMSAQGSYIITLPKSWVEGVGLKKGDNVDVEVDVDGSFRIMPKGGRLRDVPTSNSLYIENFPSMKLLDLCIKASYIQGNDVTEILSKQKLKPEQKRWIKESISGLIGTEIAEEFSDRVVLQNLVDPLKFHIDTVIQRFSEVALAVYKDAVKALQSRDYELAKDAYERGVESARLYRLLMRQVIQAARNRQIGREMGLRDIGEVLVRAVTARELSRLAYYAMRIAQHVAELEGKKVPPEIVDTITKMAQAAAEMHTECIKAFLEMDLNLANKVIDKMDEVRKKYDTGVVQLLQKMDEDSDTAVTLSLIIRDLRGVAGYAVAVADDAVLRVFAKRETATPSPPQPTGRPKPAPARSPHL